MKQKPGVMIYFDVIPVLDCLNNEEAGMLFRAILEYAQSGIHSPLNERLSLVWPLIRQRMDHDESRYQATIIKRKYGAYARWEKQNERIPLPFSYWVENKMYESYNEDAQDALA